MTQPVAADQALIEEGVLTVDGDAGPLIKTAEWTTPGRSIDLLDGKLVVLDPRSEEDTVVQPTAQMLFQFALLSRDGRDEAILDFARRYGLLALCSHHLPRGHAREAGWALIRQASISVWPPCEALGWEPTSTWRYWSRQAAALLRVIARLRVGLPGHREDWDVLSEAGPWIDDLSRATFEPQGAVVWNWPEAPGIVEVDRRLAAVAIATWQDLAGVRQTVAWRGARPELTWVTHSLLGGLAIRALLAAAGVDSLAVCASCGDGHVPARPRAVGERSFCPRCRTEGRPEAFASADYRAREAASRHMNP